MPQGWVERIPLSETIRVSVVIPHFYESREDNFRGLLEELRGQSFQEMELIVVHGVSPQGKAINQGVREAKGEVLVIIDDDSRIGHPRVIENLVRVLRDDASIGMAGASVVIPEGANWFQRTASKQFPRFNMPVVQKVTESDLPGHPCAAFPKEVLIKVGMERENILRGLDPDLRARIRQAGYRVVLAPETWIHHPLPETFSKFVRTFLRNGYGSAYLQLRYPEINCVTDEDLESDDFVEKRPFLFRMLRYPVRLVQSIVTFRWFRFLGYVVYALGYFMGLVRFTLSRQNEL